MKLIAALAGAPLWLLASPALADPCTGELPPVGVQITGQVRYVGDGDSLCIGKSPDPATWIEIRLADFYAPELSEPGGPEAKAELAKLIGRPAICRVRGRSWDRAVAYCSVNGQSVGRTMRRAGVAEGGRGR